MKATNSQKAHGMADKYARSLCGGVVPRVQPDRFRKKNPSQTRMNILLKAAENIWALFAGFAGSTGPGIMPVRLAESKINVKQNANRRIPPGRDPGGSGAW